ncbi:MAG: cupin domain-containing protein [Rhizobiales bacterium]|nr:cupin domain-containing protein [Hyphomicrobiales bacterium]
MDLYSATDRPSRQGPESYFSGTVWIDPIVEAPEPARVRALRVAFQPGARTAWHTHPLGQTLYVMSGVGRFQTEGEAVVTLRPGDTVWIPPGEKHWHGAAPDTAMVHLAIQEALDGSNVDWMEHVTDADYQAQPAS